MAGNFLRRCACVGEAGGKDYYGILGAEAGASGEELGRRYKRLAAERHPDRGGSDAEMRDLNEAYRVLRDPAARQSYDESRRAARTPADGEGDEGDEGGADAEGVGGRFSYASAYEYAPSPGARADAVWGRVAGAGLAVFAGLVLLFLVRAHYVIFLWPLALLAGALVLFGVWMAHAALAYARGGFAPTHLARRTAWAQEALFWSAVAGGVFGVYLLLVSV